MSRQLDCILLVEDDERALYSMARLLRLNGYAVVSARTAAEGRALGAEHRCGVVVCDIGLPDGAGTELIRELKDLYAPKAVAVTGVTEPEAVRKIEAGCDRYLAKPVLFTSLLQAVRDLTAGP